MIENIKKLLTTKPKETPLKNSYKEAAYRLLDKVGIPYVRHRDKDRFVWDGALLYAGNMSTGSNLIHEVAHYFVAAEPDRKIPEYGLGNAPDSNVKAPYTKAMHLRDVEESQASILGILWEKELGHDYFYTLEKHGWYRDAWAGTEQGPYGVDATLTSLITKGLINSTGKVLI